MSEIVLPNNRVEIILETSFFVIYQYIPTQEIYVRNKCTAKLELQCAENSTLHTLLGSLISRDNHFRQLIKGLENKFNKEVISPSHDFKLGDSVTIKIFNASPTMFVVSSPEMKSGVINCGWFVDGIYQNQKFPAGILAKVNTL